MPLQNTPKGTEIFSKLQAISARYAHIYGGEIGTVSMIPGKFSMHPVVFTIDYKEPDSSQARTAFHRLRGIDYTHVKELWDPQKYRIEYTLVPEMPVGKISSSLDFMFKEIGKKEREEVHQKLSVLLKSSLVLADASAVAWDKAEPMWGRVREKEDDSFDIHFSDKITAETKAKAIEHIVSAIEQSEAGRITFPSKDVLKFIPTHPARVTIPRLTDANMYMEDNIPNELPATTWQSAVDVRKYKVFAESYLQALFPNSAVALKPEQNPTEMVVKPRAKNYDAGMDRLSQLFPDTPLDIKEQQGEVTQICIPLSPQKLMLQVIGSKEMADQEFIEHFSRPSPGK